MAGDSLTGWFDQHSGDAPTPLRERAAAYLSAQPATLDLGTRLRDAARAALAAVLSRPGDRSVALDLLAADALVTLALQHQAGSDPGSLARFAAELRAQPLAPQQREGPP